MEKPGGMMSTAQLPWFAQQSSLKILLAKLSSSKARETGEGNYKFRLRNIYFVLRSDILHALKPYDM
jgi:hypothetical protein